MLAQLKPYETTTISFLRTCLMCFRFVLFIIVNTLLHPRHYKQADFVKYWRRQSSTKVPHLLFLSGLCATVEGLVW